MSAEVIANAIFAAISAGAASGATDVAKKAIVDAYSGLKSLLHKKLGSDSEAAQALQKLEEKPASEGRKQTLAEELQSSEAASDPELTAAAQSLLQLIRALPQGEQHTQTATGTGIAQAMGGSTATVTIAGLPAKHE